MNIFVVDTSPLLCARALDDKRLRKMILETAQVLCTVLNLAAGRVVTPYRNTHPGNAITLWAKRRENFDWLILLGMAYRDEYLYRFNKRHASMSVIEDIELEMLIRLVEDGSYSRYPTGWHNAAAHSSLGISFKHVPDTHLAYRLYLNARWATDKRAPTWTRRGPPSWYQSSASR